jgi:hypothetical protein
MEKAKIYPLQIDAPAYEALKSLSKIKNLSMKDLLTNAIGLLLADNLHKITISQKTDNTNGDGNTNGNNDQ